MKRIPLCATLFCTTLTSIFPISAAQTVETSYPQKPTTMKGEGLHYESSMSLLEDLSMLEEFDIQNRRAEQSLSAKLDERVDGTQLQQAIEESQIYAQSLEYYEFERPQRLRALFEENAKKVEKDIIDLRRQLFDAETKVKDLEHKLIDARSALDNTWDEALSSYVAAIDEREELRTKVLPIIEDKTKFFALLTRQLDAPKEESVVTPSPQGAATTQQTGSTGIMPVGATGSFPAIPSSALPTLSYSSSGSTSNSADKK